MSPQLHLGVSFAAYGCLLSTIQVSAQHHSGVSSAAFGCLFCCTWGVSSAWGVYSVIFVLSLLLHFHCLCTWAAVAKDSCCRCLLLCLFRDTKGDTKAVAAAPRGWRDVGVSVVHARVLLVWCLSPFVSFCLLLYLFTLSPFV